ncbi:hypothetical protein JCM8097_001371 [Rhodosporidiobolus ruineniae]
MTSIASSARSRPPPHPLDGQPAFVHARFERAVEIIQSLPKSGPIQTNYDDKLLLYSSYKQATEGDVKTGRPGLLDVLGRAKWDAWNKRKGLSQVEAERVYVDALLRILKSYSDRTQAVELLRELETFSMEPRAVAGHGSIAPSRTYSSHSSDSSTASYSSGRRSMPPPQLPSSSRHFSRSAHSARVPPPPASSTGARYRTPQPVVPSPADVVAPPLPGYGPPRTRADSVRHSPRRRRRRSRGSYASTDSGSGSESETGSSEEDTRQYHPAPSQRSFAQHAHPHSRVAPSPRGPPSLPPHPSQLPLNTPQAQHPLRPPPFHPMPSSLRSVAGSDAASLAGGSQQVAVAYPPGFVGQQQGQRVQPLTAGNLLRTAASVAPSVGAATPAQQQQQPAAPPALDAALERIQTSLTALHERLALLESSTTHSAAAGSSTSAAALAAAATSTNPLILLRALLIRIFALLRLRRPSPPPPGSPSLFRTTATRSPSLLALSARLALSLLATARRVASDALVLLALAIVLGRLRGVDVLGWARGWVVRYAVGREGGGGRGKGVRLGGA